ncbi:MAG: matrixin family metalloprotease [Gammaproteobacteria bacterium]|nr:matrixin family metalloprotease [Gammaproteobacteria bacterium]
MKTKLYAACLIAGGLSALTGTVQAFTIQFDYSYDGGFFADAQRKSLLESAGSYFESRINDDLNAITSTAGPAGNNFKAIFNRPDTGAELTLNRYSVAADTIVVFAGGRNISALGLGGPGGYSFSSSPADQVFIDNATTRGESGPTSGPTATDFAPWGGAITFDSNSSWYFDDNPITDEIFSGFDFYSVALHEIAHVLGFGTVDSWNNQVSGGSFIGDNASSLFGGPVPLADLGHWQQALTSTIDGSGSQEAAMDPNIAPGQRKRFTDLDLAALADIGWEVSAVPLPAAAYLFGAALLAMVGVGRHR